MRALMFCIITLFIFNQVYAQNGQRLNLLDFGARPNDGKDDSEAFLKVLKKVQDMRGNYIIVIPNGTYDILKPFSINSLPASIRFQGERGTVLKMRASGFGALKAASANFRLVKAANRNDNELTLDNIGRGEISAGDIVHVSSNSKFEKAWGYKENDVHRVTGVTGNKVKLASKMLFNYDPQKEQVNVVIFKNASVAFTDINFLLVPEPGKNNKARATLLAITGASVSMNNVKFDYKGDMQYYHVGASFLAAENVKMENMELNNMMYGILMNYCRNVKAYNTHANWCRHAYAPAQACYDVYVEKLRGKNCQSVMDAHPSFLVHFKDVVDTLAKEFPNCRSLGTTIENARINVIPTAYQEVCYWSVQTLVPEYEFLYGEYDTRFSNVQWVAARPSRMNGLTSYNCRNLIIENCISHNFAFYGIDTRLKQVSIKNSRAGMIYMDSQKLLLENTILDGNLYKNAPFVFKFRNAGDAVFNKVTIDNYNPDSTYLFGYFVNHPKATTGFTFNNVKIGKLRGMTNKLIYPGAAYDRIKMQSSEIAPFREELPKEMKPMSKSFKSVKH